MPTNPATDEIPVSIVPPPPPKDGYLEDPDVPVSTNSGLVQDRTLFKPVEKSLEEEYFGEVFAKAIIYGEAGSGKTVFLSTALDDERTNPCLFIDLEQGCNSIRSKIRPITITGLGKPVAGKIDVIRIDRWEELQMIYDHLCNTNRNKTTRVYKSVLFDSVTELHYLATTAPDNPDTYSLKRGIHENPQRLNYLSGSTALKRLIRGFKKLNMHVFMSALPMEVFKKDDDGNPILDLIRPSMMGKMSKEYCALMDEVVNLQVNSTGKRKMLCKPEGYHRAIKDRSEDGKLGKYIEEPTVKKFLDLLLS